MTFIECVEECLKQQELIDQFNRLWGCKLGIDKRTTIEKMIDDATGFDEQKEYMEKFVDFVYEYIWFPLLPPKK